MRSQDFVFWFSVAFFVVLPWVLALIGMLTRSTAHRMSWVSILALVIMPPIMVALFGLIPVLATRGAKTLNGAHTYEFSSNGIDVAGPGFRSRLEWSALATCVSGPMGILLMSGKVALLSVPGRVLSDDHRAGLLALARDNGLKIKSGS
jgi:hypothetical protein